MNAEQLYTNSQFISEQLKKVPKYFRDQMSTDEIRSDLSLAICSCVRFFDPEKGSDIFPYIRKSFIRNLQRTLKDKQFYQETEAPLEAAANITYEDQKLENAELLAYLSSLPNNLLGELTEFVLGKKKKEEIIDNPSNRKLNINRILYQLDQLV